ncbi:alpha/beta hydrolase [Candidatus Izemoplasma sp. B36]|uniref:alpha/beta hydrolase n=1 Tax=Candidatus Izemoplasma sp. B36 TaxID=3242468 RepID=UPI003558785F
MKEATLFIESTFKLEAIHATPKNKTEQAFLIISGSGPGDLDGNFKSLKMNMYKDVSDYLVSQGYATLRYNKRGIGKSEGNFSSTGLYDLLEDVSNAVAYLSERYKKVYLIGHSEGAILATLYNEKHNVDGMILLNGAGTGLESALNYQQQCTLDEIKELKGFKGWLLRLLVKEEKLWKQQNKFYDSIRKSTKDVVRMQLIVKINAKWMREHFEYSDQDVLDMLGKVTKPTLVIGGTKDVQANVKDLDTIDSLNNINITTKRIENMTHMLRIHEGKKSMLNLKKQYIGEIKKSLAPKLLEEMTVWLNNL